MDSYTLILVTDERSPVRRMQIEKRLLRRALGGAVAVAMLVALGTWDYWRVRSLNSELIGYRLEATEQREQIKTFERTLAETRQHIERVLDFERKVRIIANLPGAAASGGELVTELVPSEGDEEAIQVPAGVPMEVPEPAAAASEANAVDPHAALGAATSGAQHVLSLKSTAGELAVRADTRGEALESLVAELEEKRNQLLSMPSVWPAKGWLTSRYGYRVSPFTGLRQHHSGIDISARRGTPIIAPARARVSFVGRKGPLGNSLVLDHGYGVRTVYGHTAEIHVKIGDRVERGQEIAAIGSSGRSTGPHLHYTVEVKGKHRNPLDYIFN